jgi:hypothetical protein
VDTFVRRLYLAIKAEKRWVQFGISPFGIWRPGFPAQIRGFDAYAGLYADARKWLREGWVDYMAPQLYWPIHAREQSYPRLLEWWAEQNVKRRHLFIGNDATKLGQERSTDEILQQLRLTRQHPGVSGNIFWSVKPLAQNRARVADSLRLGPYAQPALPPASTWLDNTPPGQPQLTLQNETGSQLQLTWQPTGAEPVWLWALQTKSGGEWRAEVLPGWQVSRSLPRHSAPEMIALRAIDRCGIASPPAVLERQTAAPQPKPPSAGTTTRPTTRR